LENAEGQTRKRVLKIYTIVEKQNLSKGIWLEIGVARENRDGSLSGKLDALPANGTIHIREYEQSQNNGFRKKDKATPLSEWQ
jgi:hypothetical protein